MLLEMSYSSTSTDVVTIDTLAMMAILQTMSMVLTLITQLLFWGHFTMKIYRLASRELVIMHDHSSKDPNLV